MGAKIAWAISIGVVMILGFSLLSLSQSGSPTIVANDKVVFLEHYLTANGTILNGSANFRTVDFPSYWFNENTRELNGEIDFAVNESLIMIFGDSLTLAGNFGAGTGNKLYGLYTLPIKANEAVIKSIDMKGNIVLTANNKTVTLRPGRSFSYSQKERIKDGEAIIDVVYEHTYLNHGLIDKKCIKTRMIAS